MAFHISGIKEGDEVILPSHTMTASPSAVIANKGIPILVDCNEKGMINPDLIEEKITEIPDDVASVIDDYLTEIEEEQT